MEHRMEKTVGREVTKEVISTAFGVAASGLTSILFAAISPVDGATKLVKTAFDVAGVCASAGIGWASMNATEDVIENVYDLTDSIKKVSPLLKEARRVKKEARKQQKEEIKKDKELKKEAKKHNKKVVQ